VQGTGFVWSVLSDRKEATDLIGPHVDAMIDPDADLSQLAEEMVEAFIIAAREDEDGAVFLELLKHFEAEIRSMIREKDVLPSLHDTIDAGYRSSARSGVDIDHRFISSWARRGRWRLL
jgi:hypothetical protein